jgi:uncharacterized protein
MNTVDINVLLAAFFEKSDAHEVALTTLETLRSSSQSLIIFPVVASGFIRISTSRRMSRNPAATQLALSFIDSITSSPRHSVMDPGSDYWEEFSSLIAYHSARDADLTDCQIAASAITLGATLFSFDRGFAKFRTLSWVDPGASAAI